MNDLLGIQSHVKVITILLSEVSNVKSVQKATHAIQVTQLFNLHVQQDNTLLQDPWTVTRAQQAQCAQIQKCQSQYHDPQENINQVQAKQRVYHDQMATIQTSQDQLLEILFHLATIHWLYTVQLSHVQRELIQQPMEQADKHAQPGTSAESENPQLHRLMLSVQLGITALSYLEL